MTSDASADVNGDVQGDVKTEVAAEHVQHVPEPEQEKEKEMKPEPESEKEIENGRRPSNAEVGGKKTELSGSSQPALTPAPAPPPEPDMDNLPADPLPKHQHKHATTAVKAVKRLKDARPFLQPVDPVALNVPLYYNYIKRPMDLGTIERKLALNAYAQPEEVSADFKLMVDNCVRFNGESSAIAQMARNIEASFEKHMLGMPARDAPPRPRAKRRRSELETPVVIRRAESHNGRPKREIHPPRSKDIYPYETAKPRSKKYQNEIKFAQQVVKELMSKKYSSFNYPFLEPVDPVALNCPTYFDYVKQPMDLGTVSRKLNNWEYENADQVEADVRLVFKNCYAFNPDGTIVNMMGHRLEDIFNSRWVDRPITPDEDSDNEDDDDDDDARSGYSSDDALRGAADDDIDETSITNPAIQYLEQQLARMKVELQQLKTQELERIRKERRLARGNRKRRTGRKKSRYSDTGGGAGGGSGGPGGPGHGKRRKSKLKAVVTYDMKKIISERINDLPPAKLEKAVDVIRKSMPDIGKDDEVELDIDMLDNETILTLFNTFFREYATSNGNGAAADDKLLRRSSLSPNSAASSKKSARRRSKALSEQEQNKQIEKIKSKLAILDGASPTNSNAFNALLAADDSSDDGDDDDDDLSSESEEE